MGIYYLVEGSLYYLASTTSHRADMAVAMRGQIFASIMRPLWRPSGGVAGYVSDEETRRGDASDERRRSDVSVERRRSDVSDERRRSDVSDEWR